MYLSKNKPFQFLHDLFQLIVYISSRNLSFVSNVSLLLLEKAVKIKILTMY